MIGYDQPTLHAPAIRTHGTELQREIQYFVKHPDRFTILDTIPNAALILNNNRQVVYANQTLSKTYGLEDLNDVYGLRPGELLGCAHASDHPGGCGTSERCSLCGAVEAILASLDGTPLTKECRVLLKSGESLDLRVYASPLVVMGQKFCIFLITDIANEKRRQALERTFFHDILNTAGGLQSYTEMIVDSDYEEMEELGFREIMPHLTKQLVDEILSQRLLLQAEENQLTVHHESFHPKQFLDDVSELYAFYDATRHRHIVVEADAEDDMIICDHTLLGRIVGNMTKNALEASTQEQVVTLKAESGETWIEFSVNNPGVIPKEVQLQIFNRSFSTKGEGRGLGTYSIRLFGEKYLGGKVSFHSDQETGTTFKILLPTKPDQKQPEVIPSP